MSDADLLATAAAILNWEPPEGLAVSRIDFKPGIGAYVQATLLGACGMRIQWFTERLYSEQEVHLRLTERATELARVAGAMDV